MLLQPLACAPSHQVGQDHRRVGDVLRQSCDFHHFLNGIPGSRPANAAPSVTSSHGQGNLAVAFQWCISALAGGLSRGRNELVFAEPIHKPSPRFQYSRAQGFRRHVKFTGDLSECYLDFLK